ncbi:MAG: hypothetical protein M4579_000040 [Chaenotheca gracillima]|nr:MAG: hypothetical protein M4579_000040 [Chaenotheca gracillima]
MVPSITLEEHFVSSAVQEASPDDDRFKMGNLDKLTSLQDERLQDMNRGNVSVQVISHAPTTSPSSVDICQRANLQLSDAVKSHPSRFEGFAMLPMKDPTAAAQELTRCVKEYGFVGALIDNHLDGRFYDDEYFWPVFAKAQDLDVPIYLHPTYPSDEMARHAEGNFSPLTATFMGTGAWGWHSETGLHILRLFASGLFDRFPRLKIIIGHMGEMIPFVLDRTLRMMSGWEPRERDFRQVWDENIWLTTSGMFTLAPLSCVLRTTKMDRILFSVDYPFSTNEQGRDFIDEVARSGLVTNEELEMFAHGNAEKLLKLRPVA